MIDYMKNMLIGLFVAVACGLVVGMILFLEPTVGDGDQTLIMRFSNINGISVGTRVMFAGKPVGEVAKIEQIPDAREQPTDQLGQVYFYQLVLKIDSHVKAYNTDEFTIATSGLLGEKSISIIPKAPPKGVTPKRVTAKTPIYAESVDPFESTFNELAQVADKVEETLDKVNTWIDQNGNELGAAIRAFDDAMSETAIAIERINKLHVVDDTSVAIQNFGDTMGQANDALATLRKDNVFENAGIMMQNFKKVSVSVDYITDKLMHGDSTLGKLLVDEGLYLQVQSLMSKANTLLNDFNQYGLFFNLNKTWQQTRAKQASALASLDSPQDFRAYFQKEVDLINTSMGRLSMLIDRAENSSEKRRILESNAFQRDFADLMRQAEALTNNLKLYNEQLIEAAAE